jgi:hypothetical protein
MSKAVKTRTPIQCRSHHQKMVEKHGTIEGILQAATKTAGFVEPAKEEKHKII